eukprot:CAMPEP_0185038474 /NCGR_PEP_ID=MMETSP1103-20130426/34182_1 /TAXON_ID=36769 /ORGANISM="Paraphysomonas bandaiensis, Strain Caron Lab Isolate" /LENGTH=368 /DNA_ID=CAMNT_0027576917 /DNA_START=527 /DNA_END=1633 /DNA_ORIENTATION=+
MLDIRRTEKWGEPPIQTIDLFDFSVLHLSSTERLLYKTLNRSKEAKDLLEREMNHTLRSLSVYFNPHAEGNIRRMAMEGKSTALASSAISYNFKDNRRSLQELADRTLVVIPFLLSSKGESGTMKTYRKKNLKLCFWSIFPLFRNIIGAVVNDRDREQALRILPFSRVIKIPEVTVTGMCGLPMAALLQIRREMLINTTMRDSFDFIYYTEGDQVLFARKLPDIFSYLTTHQYTALSPHRLVVPSELVLQSFGRNLAEMINIGGSHSRFSCCLDTSSLAVTRVHWKPISSPSATVIKIFGVPVVAGNGNFFTQEYRVCNISHRVNHCPKNVNSATFLMYDEDPPIFIKAIQEKLYVNDMNGGLTKYIH